MAFSSNAFQIQVMRVTDQYAQIEKSGFALAAMGCFVELVGQHLESIMRSNESGSEKYWPVIDNFLHDDKYLSRFLDQLSIRLNKRIDDLSLGRHYGLVIRNVVDEVLDEYATA